MFQGVIRQFDCKKDIRYGYTPRRECVCRGGGGGEGTLIIIFLVTCARHQQLLFSLKIYQVYLGAFLMPFIKYALLMGSGGYPPCMGSGAKPVAKIVLGHSKELK